MTRGVLLAAIGIVATLAVNPAHTQSYSTMPLGGGMSTTTDDRGNTCTTVPLGGGMSTTCQ